MTGTEHRRRWVVTAAVLLALLALLVPATAVVAAQDNNTTSTTVVPYYENNSSDVANESWMDGREEPSLVNTTNLLTRVGSFVVGYGYSAQGSGPAGVMLTGGLVLAIMIASTIGADIGVVGGSVLSAVALSALVTAGLIPTWIFAVFLFLVGLATTATIIRNYQ